MTDGVNCYLFILQHIYWELLDYKISTDEIVWDACPEFLESGEFLDSQR